MGEADLGLKMNGRLDLEVLPALVSKILPWWYSNLLMEVGVAGKGRMGRKNWMVISIWGNTEMAIVSLLLWLPRASFWWHQCVSPLGNL